MLSTIELLADLLLGALTLLIGSCIVGSVAAAIRAVSRGDATSRGNERPSVSCLPLG